MLVKLTPVKRIHDVCIRKKATFFSFLKLLVRKTVREKGIILVTCWKVNDILIVIDECTSTKPLIQLRWLQNMKWYVQGLSHKILHTHCKKYCVFIDGFPPKTCKLTSEMSSRGKFYQHVYAQLLRLQIPKALKRQSTQSAFCAFGIWERNSCM